MWTVIIGWLNAKLRILEFAVLGIAIIGSFYAGYHTSTILQRSRQTNQLQTEIKVLHDVKTIHDRVNAMPASDISVGLQKWYRD